MIRSLDTSPSVPAAACARTIDDERRAWLFRHRTLLQRHGRVVTLGIALRSIRSAGTEQRLLAMIEEILVHHLGIEEFAVLEDASATPHLLFERRVRVGDMDALPIAYVPLGAGDFMLGSLLVYRLVSGKDQLDAFDCELLAALGPQIAISLHAARLDAGRRARSALAAGYE